MRSFPPRRFGWLPSTHGSVALPKGKRLASPGVATRLRRDERAIAPETDLERFVECAAQHGPAAAFGEDPIFNQAGASSCVGNAGSQLWRMAAFVHAFRPEHSNAKRMALLAKVDAPSRLVGYRGARVLTGDEHVDDGTYIQCWVDYAVNRGLPPEHTDACDLTYRDDRVLEDVTNSAAVQHAANDYKLEGAYLIDDGRSKSDVKVEVMSALSNDAPVIFGMPLDVGFERLKPGEVYRRERPLIGRHAMVVVGHDTRGVKVVNSWGPGWCFRGYGLIAWDQFLTEAADIHRCDVVPAYVLPRDPLAPPRDPPAMPRSAALPTRHLVATTALLVGLFAACHNEPTPRPPLPPYRPNTTCAEACAHRLSLGCRDGGPTAKGTSCEDVCLDVNASGMARWPTDCLVVTRTCADEGVCR